MGNIAQEFQLQGKDRHDTARRGGFAVAPGAEDGASCDAQIDTRDTEADAAFAEPLDLPRPIGGVATFIAADPLSDSARTALAQAIERIAKQIAAGGESPVLVVRLGDNFGESVAPPAGRLTTIPQRIRQVVDRRSVATGRCVPEPPAGASPTVIVHRAPVCTGSLHKVVSLLDVCRRYRWTLIDAGPLESQTVSILAPRSDQVVLVTQSGVTTRDSVARLRSDLRRCGVAIGGAIEVVATDPPRRRAA